MRYRRKVKPNKVLPPSLLKGYYEKDPHTLTAIKKWLNKNGLTILFTLGEAYGDETVWLDTDGYIYIGTEKVPKMQWLRKMLLKLDHETLKKSFDETWTQKRMFEELKKRCHLV